MRVLPVQGGSGKSRMGRALNRTSLWDKLLSCAIANAASYDVSGANDMSKLVNVANSPVLTHYGRSRVYVGDGDKGSVVSLSGPNDLWKRFKDSDQKALVSFGKKFVLKDNAEVSSMLSQRPGEFFYCSDNHYKALSLLNWNVPPTKYHQKLQNNMLLLVGDKRSPIEGFWVVSSGIYAQLGVALDISDIHKGEEAAIEESLKDDAKQILYVKRIFADASLFLTKPEFQMLPYISIEENTKAPLLYVGSVIGEPTSDIAAMSKSAVKNDIVKLLTMGVSGFSKAKKSARVDTSDMAASKGTFDMDQDETSKEAIQAQRNVLEQKMAVLHEVFSDDKKNGFITDSEFQSKVIAASGRFPAILKGIEEDDSDSEMVSKETASAITKVCSTIFMYAPALPKAFKKADAKTAILALIDIAELDTDLSDNNASKEALPDDKVGSGKNAEDEALNAIREMSRAGALSFGTAHLIETALKIGTIDPTEVQLLSGSATEQKVDDAAYKKMLASKVLTFAEVLRSVPGIEVTSRPLAASRTDFTWYDSKNNSMHSISKSPLQYLSQANSSIWDSLGSYAFVESNNPGSMGFNNDIKNAMTNNLNSQCIWFYPPSAPLKFADAMSTLTMIQGVSEKTDMSSLYASFRLKDARSFDKAQETVFIADTSSKEPLLSQELRQITDGMVYFTNLSLKSATAEVHDTLSDLQKFVKESGVSLDSIPMWDKNVLAAAAAVASFKAQKSSGKVTPIEELFETLVDASSTLAKATIFDTVYTTSRETERRYLYLLACPLIVGNLGMAIRCGQNVYFFADDKTVFKAASDATHSVHKSIGVKVDLKSAEELLSVAFFKAYEKISDATPFCGLITEVN